MMKILALDVGNKRIGTAVSDELGMFAHPLYTVKRKGLQNDIDTIIKIIDEHRIGELVIGLPKNMDGTIGSQGEKTIYFAEAIKSKKDIKITYWDERLSTKTAKDIMLLNDIRQIDKKEIVDTIAAVVILDNYLSSIRKG
ncbi:MAG: Holliday junction resolvase RuvX [Peptostreptococcaceae bacterium]|nr:Holliday junction resolvase RuvX [Peptostreptococcaceae bacterium]